MAPRLASQAMSQPSKSTTSWDAYGRLDLDREIHPIPVPLTEGHDQRKGWIAWRWAVDL